MVLIFCSRFCIKFLISFKSMGGLFYQDRLLGDSFVITKKLLQSPNSVGAIKSKLLTQMPTHQTHVFFAGVGIHRDNSYAFIWTFSPKVINLAF